MFYRSALKATEIVNPNQSEANYGNLQTHSQDVDMTEDIYERIFDLLNQIIKKLENTYIIKDGPDKTFEPKRKHTHKYEHKLFYNWLTFFKRTLKNMNKNPKTILESIYFCRGEYKNFIDVRCKFVETYLSTWMDNSVELLNSLKNDFKFVRDDKVKETRHQSVFSFCKKFIAELDGYINEAFEYDKKLFILCYEDNSLRSYVKSYLLLSESEKIFKLINEHPYKKPELKNETKINIHNSFVRKFDQYLYEKQILLEQTRNEETIRDENFSRGPHTIKLTPKKKLNLHFNK